MGWCSGGQLAEDLWDSIRPHVKSKKARKKLAREIIDMFEGMDCDVIDECTVLCKDAGRKYDDETGEIVYD